MLRRISAKCLYEARRVCLRADLVQVIENQYEFVDVVKGTTHLTGERFDLTPRTLVRSERTLKSRVQIRGEARHLHAQRIDESARKGRGRDIRLVYRVPTSLKGAYPRTEKRGFSEPRTRHDGRQPIVQRSIDTLCGQGALEKRRRPTGRK